MINVHMPERHIGKATFQRLPLKTVEVSIKLLLNKAKTLGTLKVVHKSFRGTL